MIENQQLRRSMIVVGYFAWFVVLVRVLFLSTNNPNTDTAEILGSHVGLAFWLLVLALIPYFMARARAKKAGIKVSWPYVMTGVTMIAIALSVGGFYGQLHTSTPSSSSAELIQSEPTSAAPSIEDPFTASAKPANSSDEEWKSLISDAVMKNLGQSTTSPYIYYLPNTDSSEFSHSYELLSKKVTDDVSRGVLPGNVLAYGSPASLQMASIVINAYEHADADSMRGVRVIYLGLVPDSDRVRASVSRTGADYVFVDMSAMRVSSSAP